MDVVFIFRRIIGWVTEFAMLSKEEAPLSWRKLFSYDHLEHAYVLKDVANMHFFLQLSIVIRLYPLKSTHL